MPEGQPALYLHGCCKPIPGAHGGKPIVQQRLTSYNRQAGNRKSSMQVWTRIALILVMAAAAACTRVPELEDRLTPDLRDADYPVLLPLDDALEPLDPPQQAGEELQEELDARSARLKRRAEALKNAEF